MDIINFLKGKIIVSSQAMPDEPLYKEECMLAMMASVINGGASALRVAGARDVKNAKEHFKVPVIGLTKPSKIPPNYKELVYITPTLSDVKSLIEAGADIIAFDGTLRKHIDSHSKIIEEIHNAGKIAMADISILEEGIYCSNIGADIISTTLAGYTTATDDKSTTPDFNLLKELTQNLKIPVFLEGRVWTPEDARKGFELGAHSVVIGSAITRPQLITKRFIEGTKNL